MPYPPGNILCAYIDFCIKKNVRCPLARYIHVVGDLTHTKAPECGAFDSKSPSPTGVGGWGHTLIGALPIKKCLMSI